MKYLLCNCLVFNWVLGLIIRFLCWFRFSVVISVNIIGLVERCPEIVAIIYFYKECSFKTSISHVYSLESMQTSHCSLFIENCFYYSCIYISRNNIPVLSNEVSVPSMELWKDTLRPSTHFLSFLNITQRIVLRIRSSSLKLKLLTRRGIRLKRYIWRVLFSFHTIN